MKALQQQVKEQQETLAKMNPEPATLAGNERRPHCRTQRYRCAALPDNRRISRRICATNIRAATGRRSSDANGGSTIPNDRRGGDQFRRNDFVDWRGELPDRADDDRRRRQDLHEHFVRLGRSRLPIRALATWIISKWEIMIRSSAASIRAMQNWLWMVRSTRISRVSPTSF